MVQSQARHFAGCWGCCLELNWATGQAQRLETHWDLMKAHHLEAHWGLQWGPGLAPGWGNDWVHLKEANLELS